MRPLARSKLLVKLTATSGARCIRPFAKLTTEFEERWHFTNVHRRADGTGVNELHAVEGEVSAPVLREALGALALMLALDRTLSRAGTVE